MEIQSGMVTAGYWTLEVYDSEGNPKYPPTRARNLVTTQGLNYMLNTSLDALAQSATWYCALSSTNTAAASTMTYAVPVFTEFTLYDEATRPTYTAASSTVASITNSANKAVFTISATVSGPTIYSAALMSSNPKGDAATTATLFSYALFSTSRAVVATDVLNLTYTIGAS